MPAAQTDVWLLQSPQSATDGDPPAPHTQCAPLMSGPQTSVPVQPALVTGLHTVADALPASSKPASSSVVPPSSAKGTQLPPEGGVAGTVQFAGLLPLDEPELEPLELPELEPLELPELEPLELPELEPLELPELPPLDELALASSPVTPPLLLLLEQAPAPKAVRARRADAETMRARFMIQWT